MKLICIPLLIAFSPIIQAAVEGLPASTKTVVSVDSLYTPTSDKDHNYRYRAVFSQDTHNEIPGTLNIEKVQLPDATGSPHKIAWSHKVDLSKIKATATQFNTLPFESAIGCCNYSDLNWSGYNLKFKVAISNKSFQCTTSDVSKGMLSNKPRQARNPYGRVSPTHPVACLDWLSAISSYVVDVSDLINNSTPDFKGGAEAARSPSFSEGREREATDNLTLSAIIKSI